MTDWAAFYDDTRSDWNARPPTSSRTSVDISKRTEFFNHYIGPGSPGYANRPHADCLAAVRSWQLMHQNKGWKDIGYNALVCGHARVIEGRGLGYAGSHCPDHNTSGFGVQFMVAGTERPTDAMYARMRKLYDDLVRAKGGALAKRGHRDGVATTCPGDIVYAWVKAGMPGPTITPPPPDPPEDDMAISDDEKRIILGRLDYLANTVGPRTETIRLDVVKLAAELAVVKAAVAADDTDPLDPARAEAIFREEVAARLDEVRITDEGVQQ
jgi:hypothetical protein